MSDKQTRRHITKALTALNEVEAGTGPSGTAKVRGTLTVDSNGVVQLVIDDVSPTGGDLRDDVFKGSGSPAFQIASSLAAVLNGRKMLKAYPHGAKITVMIS